jgi:hypothetical protein
MIHMTGHADKDFDTQIIIDAYVLSFQCFERLASPMLCCDQRPLISYKYKRDLITLASSRDS